MIYLILVGYILHTIGAPAIIWTVYGVGWIFLVIARTIQFIDAIT